MRPLKTASIVIGFLSSLLGTLGSFVFINDLNQELQLVRDQRSAMVAQVESLNNVQLQYFMANQQGDMIFALVQDTARARPDVTALLFGGNVLDRAAPMRNLIGTLALAHKLDYIKTYEGYVQLNQRARESGAMVDYQKLKLIERDTLELGAAHVATLHQAIATADQKVVAIEASLRWRQTILIALTSFGAAILLLANLIEERQAARSARPRDTTPAKEGSPA
jgi:hypothetical protein